MHYLALLINISHQSSPDYTAVDHRAFGWHLLMANQKLLFEESVISSWLQNIENPIIPVGCGLMAGISDDQWLVNGLQVTFLEKFTELPISPGQSP